MTSIIGLNSGGNAVLDPFKRAFSDNFDSTSAWVRCENHERIRGIVFDVNKSNKLYPVNLEQIKSHSGHNPKSFVQVMMPQG